MSLYNFFIDKDIRMKELSVRECAAVSGGGITDFLRPGTGDVSPSVTPEKPAVSLLSAGGSVWASEYSRLSSVSSLAGSLKFPADVR